MGAEFDAEKAAKDLWEELPVLPDMDSEHEYPTATARGMIEDALTAAEAAGYRRGLEGAAELCEYNNMLDMGHALRHLAAKEPEEK